MKTQRIDHIGINVIDLQAAKEFFLEMGFEVKGEQDMEGELLDNVTGLIKAKTSLVFMTIAGTETSIELVTYHSPEDKKGIQHAEPYKLGVSHLCFAVEDLDGLLERLKKKGATLVGKVQNYENIYKLVYIRGPEGIILELAEKLT